jgi:hypothetical protein
LGGTDNRRSALRLYPSAIITSKHHCCPNLDAHGIGAGTHEGFDFKLLLEPFEKQLNQHSLTRPAGEAEVIGIAPIQHHDASPRKIKPLGHFDITGLAVGHMPEDLWTAVESRSAPKSNSWHGCGLSPI